jgi:predicted ATPase/DNA-binding CsgD family transcriptional regulator
MEPNAHQARSGIGPFSLREIEILRAISDGMSNHEIARKLALSLETIKWYNKQIFVKLGVNSRTQAVNKAAALGLLAAHRLAAMQEESRRPRHNLPAWLSSFVGREKEMADIRRLLEASRLVVLTGPGGCGKSRLASRVAAELVGIYPDGVWLVEFASIRDPALVAHALAQLLQVNARSDQSPGDAVKSFLEPKHLLLLLDNIEHLPEAHPLVGELLAAAPQVTVLATTRERLHIYGEQEYPVHPFSVPDPRAPDANGPWLDLEAIQLFVQRARAVDPGFTADEPQLLAIATICFQLDGLPLAIELAASMVKTLPPSLLAEQLDKDPGALTSGPRDLPARQRTLRATLDWSYNLLQDDERTFFARLAVFCGGGTLEAILHVCPNGLARDPLALLSGLVGKNLVYTCQDSDGEQRFMMLNTVHEYAAERLSESSEADSIRGLHAEYYTRLVEAAADGIRGPKQDYWFARLRAEPGNLQEASAWSSGRVGV